MKNVNLKKRIMATVVSTAVVFGGAVAVAPAADADVRITNQYSSLSDYEMQQAVQYNQQFRINTQMRNMDLLNTTFGPGWCIDANLQVPQWNTQYEVRKLDGTSGFYGFNGNLEGDLNIHPDIERAAIHLTKLMLDDYKAGRTEDVKKKNLALQALLSNHVYTLDQIRGLISGELRVVQPGPSGTVPPKVTKQEFLQWTGFEVRRNIEKPIGQSQFYLVKNDSVSQRLNVNAGEYVTILVPRSYNVHQDQTIEPTNQRIVLIGQPGLKGYDPLPDNPVPSKSTETVTKTVHPDPVTVTKTERPTTTVTVHDVPAPDFSVVTERPTVTLTNFIQPVEEYTEYVRPADTTVTSTRRPSVVTTTKTETRDSAPVTVTETAPQKTITYVKQEPVVVTVTATERPTVTQTAANKTATVTQTAAPVYKTATVTRPATTKTVTKTAEQPTSVVTETVTQTNKQTIEKTVEVERNFRHYNFSLDFAGSDKSQDIEVKDLRNWKIEFVDDSNGLVKVEKVIVNGKETLRITPVKKGRGEVRIIITDNEGNRHEYTINVVNEEATKTETKNIVVNNHFFNVGSRGFELPISLNGKTWKVTEGRDLATVTENNGKLTVKVKSDVTSGKIAVELKDGDGNTDNYIFQVNVSENSTQKTLFIGNFNSYTLDVANVPNKPKVVSGGDLIESIEKKGDFWVITPAEGAEGDVVIEAKDAQGVTYTYTLRIQSGYNVGVTRQQINIFAGNTITIPYRDGETLTQDIVSGDWQVQKPQNGVWVINNNGADGTAVFRVYREIAGQKVLVGEYTIVAKPLSYEPNTRTEAVSDRGWAELTPGNATSRFELKEGADLGELKEDQGTWRFEPKEGAQGRVVIHEIAQNNGQDVVITVINLDVKKSDVAVDKRTVTSGGTISIQGLQSLGYDIVEGKDLVDSIDGDIIKLKPNADGKVVVEIKNQRGLVTQRVEVDVTRPEVKEERITLFSNSELNIDLPGEGYTFTTNNDKVKIEQNGQKLTVTPTEGAEGETVIEVKDPSGNVRFRYILDIKPSSTNGGGESRNHEFKLTEGSTFTITRVNNNTIRVLEGESYVTVNQDTNQWKLVPKPGSAGEKITVVEERNNTIVNRYTIDVTPAPTDLKITVERRVLQNEIDGRITPLKPGNKLTVRRGYDKVVEQEFTQGQLYLKPLDRKSSGTVFVEETDPQGNVVRIIEVEVPSQAGETIPEPNVQRASKPNDPYRVNVTGGSNSIEVNLCTGENSCTIVTEGVHRNDDGSYSLDPGAVKPGTKQVEFVGIENGILKPNDKVVIDVETTVINEKGSSDEAKRCLATLAGLSAPLLLLIPVGLLAQVQIPGLEGVSAQINGAIRQANDYVQRGLGIYDRERAQRAANWQGKFAAVNPEFIGLAAGSLGLIALGLVLTDIALKQCGQEEMTSSYQLGKATGNEALMNGSSTSSEKTGSDNK